MTKRQMAYHPIMHIINANVHAKGFIKICWNIFDAHLTKIPLNWSINIFHVMTKQEHIKDYRKLVQVFV